MVAVVAVAVVMIASLPNKDGKDGKTFVIKVYNIITSCHRSYSRNGKDDMVEVLIRFYIFLFLLSIHKVILIIVVIVILLNASQKLAYLYQSELDEHYHARQGLSIY